MGFLGELVIKNPPAKAGDMRDRFWSLDWEDPLEEGMATHSSILTWRILWTEEPGGLQSIALQRVKHYWSRWESTHVQEMKLVPHSCFSVFYYCWTQLTFFPYTKFHKENRHTFLSSNFEEVKLYQMQVWSMVSSLIRILSNWRKKWCIISGYPELQSYRCEVAAWLTFALRRYNRWSSELQPISWPSQKDVLS